MVRLRPSSVAKSLTWLVSSDEFDSLGRERPALRGQAGDDLLAVAVAGEVLQAGVGGQLVESAVWISLAP